MDATIELDTLALFVRVAQSQSFTRAARDMGVPTSTVSRAIARLEDRLGVRLLQRTTRNIALTAEGAALLERAATPLRELQAATSAVSHVHGAPSGTLRLTAPIDLGTGFVAQVVSGFVARYPGVSVDVMVTNRMVDLVGEGFDVALRAGELTDSTLVAAKIGETPSCLFASPAYLARRGTPREPADLAHHDGVVFRGARGVQKWRLNGPGGVVEVDVPRRVVGDDFGFLWGALRQGAGIGLVPALLAQNDLEAGHLVRVLPAYEARGGGLHVVYPSARHVPAKVTAFRDFAIERFRSLCVESRGG